MNKNGLVFTISYYLLICLIGISVFIPVLWLFSSSLKDEAEIFLQTYPITWKTFIPTKIDLAGYVRVLTNTAAPFHRYLLNSLFVTASVIIFGIFVNSLAAFAFARLNFPLKNLLFIIVLVTLMMPFETLVIPLYVLMKRLNWVNTYQALIVPGIANSFVIFLLRQFFAEIPAEMGEAAKIDGCSWFGVYWRIFLPMSKSSLVTVSLIMFISQWKSFFWPLIIINSDKYNVVTVGVTKYTGGGFTMVQWGPLFAAASLATLPILIIFIFMQRFYVQGITLTGTKG